MSIILGVNAYHGDSSACILQDGELIAAVEEERFRRIKHWAGFPSEAIKYCLNEGRLSIKDVDYIVFYDKPFLTFERLLMSYLTVAPKGLKSWLASMPLWLGQKLNIIKAIKKETGYENDVLFTEHHEAHQASAFYLSPFNEAAI